MNGHGRLVRVAMGIRELEEGRRMRKRTRAVPSLVSHAQPGERASKSRATPLVTSIPAEPGSSR